MRGVDSEGHAANYVETEQIIEYDNSRCSFVQTRGSIPLYWSQYPNLKYKPDPVISSAHSQVAKIHHSFVLFAFGWHTARMWIAQLMQFLVTWDTM